MLLFLLIIPLIVVICYCMNRFSSFIVIAGVVMCLVLAYTDFWMGVLLPVAILSPIVYIVKRLTRDKEIEVNANGPHEVVRKKPKTPRIFKGTPLEVEYLNTNGAWVGRNNIVWEVE